MGYSYNDIDGKMVKDEQFGQYLIKLSPDGTYVENGNSTSGRWKREGDQITLSPEKFQDMTPEEHRKRFRKSDGSPSITIERLVKVKMKPMVLTYVASSDRILHQEPTLHYEYERTN